MTEVLSQAEINQLLTAISTGVVEGEEAIQKAESKKIKIYDFKRPDTFSKYNIMTLQRMHEIFARLTSASMSAELSANVQLHVASVDQLTYEEFLRSIPNPTCFNIINMDPLPGPALLEIDPSIIYSIVDRLFGGTGDLDNYTDEMTDLELSVIREMMARTVGNLREAWSNVIDLHPGLVNIETDPRFAQIVPPYDMVMLVTFEIHVGETEGQMNFCVPYITIKSIRSNITFKSMKSGFGGTYWPGRRLSKIRKPEHGDGIDPKILSSLKVSSEVFYRTEHLALDEIYNLKPGKLIKLDTPDRDEVNLTSSGQPVLKMHIERKPGELKLTAIDEPAPGDKDLQEILDPGKRSDSKLQKIREMVNTPISQITRQFQSSMKELSNSITCISKRQDEMSDQINFSTSENSKPEIMKPTTGRPFEFTRMVDIKFILDFILGEHPQTIAMILSHLETEKGAIIISVLPEELQPLVTERIAIMGRVSPDVLNKVSRVMELKLKILSDQDYADSGGLGAAAELLSLVDRGTEKNVIETLKKKDPELAEEIKMRMFVFEDIILLSPDDVKSVLERADMTDILLALKGVSSEVQDFILENLTAKRAEKARKELAVRNPKRLIEVEEGQQNIEKIIRSMEEDGKIVVDRPGGKV
ncbi:hypothetical protein ES705_25428 [subsurface metagenome]